MTAKTMAPNETQMTVSYMFVTGGRPEITTRQKNP